MSKSSDEDKEFIRAQMQGVKRLKKNNIAPPAIKKVPAKKLKQTITAEEIKRFEFSDRLTQTVVSESKLLFYPIDLPKKTLLALKQGKLKISQSLDLHGFTIEEARNRLSDFLDFCFTHHHRCILIVHGKGKLDVAPPLLKNYVNTWLPQHPKVLAYCSAIPRDGGTGAVYVLLKRNKMVND